GRGDRPQPAGPDGGGDRAHDHADDVPPAVVNAGTLDRARRAGSLGRPGRRPTGRDDRDGGGLMYGWVWRHLPGPALVRALILLVVAVALVALLFEVVFPAIAPLLPLDQNTVE